MWGPINTASDQLWMTTSRGRGQVTHTTHRHTDCFRLPFNTNSLCKCGRKSDIILSVTKNFWFWAVLAAQAAARDKLCTVDRGKLLSLAAPVFVCLAIVFVFGFEQWPVLFFLFSSSFCACIRVFYRPTSPDQLVNVYQCEEPLSSFSISNWRHLALN